MVSIIKSHADTVRGSDLARLGKISIPALASIPVLFFRDDKLKYDFSAFNSPARKLPTDNAMLQSVAFSHEASLIYCNFYIFLD